MLPVNNNMPSLKKQTMKKIRQISNILNILKNHENYEKTYKTKKSIRHLIISRKFIFDTFPKLWVFKLSFIKNWVQCPIKFLKRMGVYCAKTTNQFKYSLQASDTFPISNIVS